MGYGKKKPVRKNKPAAKRPMMTYGGAMAEATRQIKMKKGGKTPTALINALKAAGHIKMYGGAAKKPVMKRGGKTRK